MNARVNRVFKDKPGGLVVDYIGIGSELKKALKIYTDSKGRGAPTLLAEEAFALLLEKLEVVRSMFHRFDYSDYETNAIMLLPMPMCVKGIFARRDSWMDSRMSFPAHPSMLNRHFWNRQKLIG